ncbi:MAG: hypothetical protein M1272_02075 [Firmicutes bacterium]|nr:hypothetical protein [Bacillota bacterium]
MDAWTVLGRWAISSTVQTGLMVAILSAVGLASGRHLAPRWWTGLWLLVLLRLAVPWTPGTLFHLPMVSLLWSRTRRDELFPRDVSVHAVRETSAVGGPAVWRIRHPEPGLTESLTPKPMGTHLAA